MLELYTIPNKNQYFFSKKHDKCPKIALNNCTPASKFNFLCKNKPGDGNS